MVSDSALKSDPVAVYSYFLGNPVASALESPEGNSASVNSLLPKSLDSSQHLPSKWYGCSGFLWEHRGKSWGITNGSVLIPFIENAPADLKRTFVKSQTNGLRRTYDRQILDTIELNILKDNSTNFSARIAAVWSCPLLAAGIEQLMDMGWRFNGFEEDLKMTLPMIAIFLPTDKMICCNPRCIAEALVTLLSMIPEVFLRGDPVRVVSSPFAGNMVPLACGMNLRYTRASNQGHKDPEIIEGGSRNYSLSLPPTTDNTASYYIPFLNSWSQGLVSGTCGINKIIIITDASTAIGSEGGPLLVGSRYGGKGKWHHAGMMLRSLCYWRDEFVGYSIALNLRSALLEFLRKKPMTTSASKTSLHATVENVSAIANSHQPSQIVLVRCGHHYSSGIPINEELGLILTCAHGVQQFENGISVSWILNSSGYKVKQVNAKLIYKTPQGKTYDIALISVGPGSGLAGIPIAKDPPITGEDVVSVGFALNFGKNMELKREIEWPLISGGVVAAVIPGNPPPKLQTTCCVQAGCSGGAILRKVDGTLLGVIVCNTAKHSESSTFPHMNFSVPAISLKPFLEAYYRTQDPTVLNGIHTQDKKVQRIWCLGEKETSQPIERSKL